MSLWGQIRSEITREYVLLNDEGRYTSRRRKMYAFMTIPLELETFMSYGILHCLDSFLFVVTFLPLRFISALFSILGRVFLFIFGIRRASQLCRPAETIDILRGTIILVCVYFMAFIDTSMMYHIIKSQSVIKLYVFYNMLEVGDRLCSAFGQDTIDTLFWTAIHPNKPKKHYIGFIPLIFIALVYAFLHTLVILLQATTLNVAINAANKALLTIMMSNNFVELKSSVFKKFDKKNLFHVSCSDVRERFHLCALLFIVVVQTMKEYGWKEDCFWSLAPECFMIMIVEFMVDWIKHAFITRFNEVSTDVYRDYTTSLAYDLAQSKQKSSSSDHCDWISRRIGFIPLPVGVVIIRVISTSIQVNSLESILLLILAYFSLVSCRLLVFVLVMGKGCNLINEHKKKLIEEEESPEIDSDDEAVYLSDTIDPNPKVLEVKESNIKGDNNDKLLLPKEPLHKGSARERKRTFTGPKGSDKFDGMEGNHEAFLSPLTRFVINRSISTPDLIKRNVSE